MTGMAWMFLALVLLWLLFALRNVLKWIFFVLLFVGGGLIEKIIQVCLFVPVFLWTLIADDLFNFDRMRRQKGGCFVFLAKLLLIVGAIGTVVYLIRK